MDYSFTFSTMTPQDDDLFVYRDVVFTNDVTIGNTTAGQSLFVPSGTSIERMMVNTQRCIALVYMEDVLVLWSFKKEDNFQGTCNTSNQMVSPRS